MNEQVLRMEPPFVTVHTFCASRGIQIFLRNLPSNITFLWVYDHVVKPDLSKGYQNPKRKLGVARHFSEITALKFGKKLPYILCNLMLFLELWLLNYL